MHVIVAYDDRPIDVQLRTRAMHEWAITVERLSGRLEEDLKSGHGPMAVLDWLQAISEAMALEESGLEIDAAAETRLSQLKELAVPFLQGGPS